MAITEPITREALDLLSVRLDNIRAMMGVGATIDVGATNPTSGAFPLLYITIGNWIRAIQLASEVTRAATALSGPQLEEVTVAIHRHVELLRAALSQAENVIAESGDVV